MARLPKPGSDDGVWGGLLNEFLEVEHNPDGTLKPGASLGSKVNTSTTVNGQPLSSNVTLSKTDIALGNVDNVQQVPLQYLDTDGSLAASSDTKIASQKAAKTYTDSKIAKSSLGAKGDLLVASAASTPSNLPVATDGKFLVTDNSQPLGLKWGDAPAELVDWSANSNYGSAKTLTGATSTVQRQEGTLDQNTTVTINLTNNQQLELILHQDTTGGRVVTWQGVHSWSTLSGTQPVLNSTPESTERFYFERINGVVYGYHITEAVAAASHTHPYYGSMGFRSGFYYGPSGRRNPIATVASRMYCIPWYVGVRQAFTSMNVHVTVIAASSTIRLGIYTDTGFNAPGTLLIEPTSTTQLSGATTGIKTAPMNITLEPGIYWLACVAQGGAPTLAGLADDQIGLGLPGSATSFANSPTAYHVASTAGALPVSNPAAVEFASGAPSVMLRV